MDRCQLINWVYLNVTDECSEITRLFPSIQYLDQQPVGPKISFGLGDIVNENAETASLPVPIRGNFFDSPDTQAMVLEFLTTYVYSLAV